MSRRYFSVCSGIEAATVAWHPLGWVPVGFAEIDAFPSAVLAHHFPSVPNHGDFTRVTADVGAVDLLVGGTPCQSFSIAGLRGGLADERGNLALEYLRLADRLRPRWLVWENVPGVLSSNGGRDFGAFLGALVELGYGFAYRVLDAQFFGVPQRRRRVFVVGCAGDWRRAAAVLFERESLRGNPAPRRKAREEVAGTLGGGSGSRGWAADTDRMTFVPEVAKTLLAKGTGGPAGDEVQNLVPAVCVTGEITHTLKAEGADASEDGTGRGNPIIAQAFRWQMGGAASNRMNLTPEAPTLDSVPSAVLAFDAAQITSAQNRSQPAPGKPSPALTKENANRAMICFSSKDHGADAGEVAPTLRAGGHVESHANAGAPPAIAYSVAMASDPIWAKELAQPITRRNGDPGVVASAMRVRRLTPRECERLQGFPDDWTLVPCRNKPAADGPRYKAIGNSMAVPVMRWIGRRIDLAEQMTLAEVA